MNPLIILEETVEAIDTTAVDKMLEWLKTILETPIATIGGTTLTVGLLIFAVIKFIFPKNKIIANQETTIDQLEKENEKLKETATIQEARIATLEAQMKVVTENTPNKRVQGAKTIRIEPQQVTAIKANATRNVKRRVKVKVAKAVTAAATGAEAVINGN